MPAQGKKAVYEKRWRLGNFCLYGLSLDGIAVPKWDAYGVLKTG
jgi:hypothetical protein